MSKLIVAHRGASKAARENTLEAFQKAIDAGADMIELDVRRTADDVLVVAHDAHIGEQMIRQLRYAEVAELSPRCGYQVPTLEQALRLGAGKIKFDLELKERGCEDDAVRLAAAILPAGDFIVTSFRAPVIIRVKKLYPHVPAGLLREPVLSAIYQAIHFADFVYLFDSFWGRRKAIAVSDFISLNVLLHAAGLAEHLAYQEKPYYIYTVDDENLIARLWADRRLLGVITNVPAAARAKINSLIG